MATIPSGSKIMTVASTVNTRERKSTQANSPTEYYTIEDVKETVLPDYTEMAFVLTQTSTGAPTVLDSWGALADDVVWTRTIAGRYEGTLAGAFPVNKTVVLQGSTARNLYIYTYPAGGNTIQIQTFNDDVLEDEVLFETIIIVRVYN
jgi:hypothetical protein